MSKAAKKETTVEEPQKEYVMDFDRLAKLTNQKPSELAKELGVVKSFISVSKTKPKILNRFIVNYLNKYNQILPMQEFLVEEPQKAKKNGK